MYFRQGLFFAIVVSTLRVDILAFLDFFLDMLVDCIAQVRRLNTLLIFTSGSSMFNKTCSVACTGYSSVQCTLNSSMWGKRSGFTNTKSLLVGPATAFVAVHVGWLARPPHQSACLPKSVHPSWIMSVMAAMSSASAFRSHAKAVGC